MISYIEIPKVINDNEERLYIYGIFRNKRNDD